ncbi:MAG: hypothetical protein GEU90_02235, partial [Gemmatimonas sp.]|nr:hypothetical protein [Gemmatimonas sp.]
MARRELEFHVAGLEFREGDPGRYPVLFDSLHAGAEDVEREGSHLIGIGEPIPLSRQLLESGFSLLDSRGLIGRCRGGPLRPGRQFRGEGVGVDEQITDRGPDRLVDTGGSEAVVGTAASGAVRERGRTPAADIVVIEVLPAGFAGVGLAGSD